MGACYPISRGFRVLGVSFGHMSHHHAPGHTHGDLLAGLAEHLQPLFEESKQGIYVYFDDEHKICNEKFASLLGYDSAEDWAGMEGPFPVLFVAEKSQDALIGAYQNAMQDMVASTTAITWTKKTGGTVETTVTLVPISFEGHLFALHFVA